MTNKDDKQLYNAFMLDVETALAIFELAQRHGKKKGDNIQDEFEEIKREHPEKFKLLGVTDKDADLFSGECRQIGLKVFNPHEEERRRENNDKR